MSDVLVITRNGEGDVWRVSSLREARLSPIVQTYDVVASDPETLLRCYGRSGCESLGRRAPIGPLGDRVRRHLEGWSAEGGRPSDEVLSSVRELWRLLMGTAQPLPTAADVVVAQVRADRLAMESSPIRVVPDGTSRHDQEYEEVTDAETKVRAARISDTMIIHMGKDAEGKKYGKDHNPTREGSAVHPRFAKYVDGMTVAQAKDAGITPGDIKYHAAPERAFITLKVDPKAEAAAQKAAEDKVKAKATKDAEKAAKAAEKAKKADGAAQKAA